MRGARRGRKWRRILVILGGLFLVWVAWLSVSLTMAARDLVAAVDILNAARSRAQLTDITSDRLLTDLFRAKERFARAHARLTEPTSAPVKVLPFVGRQMRSLVALSSAAEKVTDVGTEGVAEVRRLLPEEAVDGSRRPALVRQLSDVAQRAAERLASIPLGPRVGLLPPLAQRHNELAGELDQLQAGLTRGAVGGRVAAEILSSPGRYLILAANNAEMRAGSGMFLSVGELRTGDGLLRLSPMTTVENILVPEGAVPLEGDLDARWGWLKPNVDWRNLMLSPRFDASAQLASRMWVALGHEPVDGVIALDPVMLQGLLRATGPIAVENRTIDADNVLQLLLHDQYLEFPSDVQIAQRRELLGAIAAATFDAVNDRRLSLPTLADGLARAIRGRHLMLWSSRAENQSALTTVGVDGGLRPDSLLVSMLNRGGTKLDWFLQVSGELSFQAEGSDTRGVLRVVFENHVPPGQPAYIAGPREGSGAGPGEYLGIMTVTLPGFARGARIDGVEKVAVAGPDGPTRVVGFQLSIPAGGRQTVLVHFLLPRHEGSLLVEPTARIPAMHWTSGGHTWSDAGSRRITWRTAVQGR